MAELVWTRDYLEKTGAKVEWNESKGAIVVDGKIEIYPQRVEGGKSYADKGTLDAVLVSLGYTTPTSTPSTSQPSPEIVRREQREQQLEQVASRGLRDTWESIKTYFGDKLDAVRSWVVQHIWSPLCTWANSLVNSLKTIMTPFSNLYWAVYSWLQKVRYAISYAARWVQQEIIEWYGGIVSWVKEHLEQLKWIISQRILQVIHFLDGAFDRLYYITQYAFNQLRMIVEGPVHWVADCIVAGFEFWAEKIFDLVEDYVCRFWEG